MPVGSSTDPSRDRATPGAAPVVGLVLLFLVLLMVSPLLVMVSDGCMGNPTDPRLICTTPGQGFVGFGPPGAAFLAIVVTVVVRWVRPRSAQRWTAAGYLVTLAAVGLSFAVLNGLRSPF